MSKIKIFNENCINTMKKMVKFNKKIDLILTSPPYNISRGVTTEEEINKHKSKYKKFKDNLPNEEYRNFIVDVFMNFNNVLNKNGVVLLNLSYASCIETNSKCGDMIRLLYEIIDKTNFELADIITWKKKSALPNNRSSNKLTRINEYIYVFCRKEEYSTFNCNKKLTSYNQEKNLKFYENIYNFVEAKNNDGSNSLNKATFSVELCEKLLSIYANNKTEVYDPFMGTGTTAVACEKMGLNCYGSEIDEEQVEYSYNRINNIKE